MSKTNATIWIVFACLVFTGIVGSVVVLAVNPTAHATFVQNLIVLLGLATTAAGTFSILGDIKKNTNGTLSAKDAEIDRLRAIAAKNGINPDAVEHKTPIDAQEAARHASD